MAEIPSGVQGGSNNSAVTSGGPDNQLNTSNLTTGDALAASSTTEETLAAIERPSLDTVMESIIDKPPLDPSVLLPYDVGLTSERIILSNRMEQLEMDRQALIEAYHAGNYVCTDYSNHTLEGLNDYITNYNALAGAVSTYNGLVGLGNTITQMQALPFQVAGTAILGISAIQAGQSAYTYALSNPVGVTTFADDFLNTLLIPGPPSPSFVGYGTGIATSIADKFDLF